MGCPGDGGRLQGRELSARVREVRGRRPSVKCQEVHSRLSKRGKVRIGSGQMLHVYEGCSVGSGVG